MKPLQNTIAVVTGASRGAGRGIAYELGEAGTTVYVTGRSIKGSTTDDRPETIEETATGVTKRGGKGIAVRCDHTDPADVRRLFRRIKDEHGRIDLLVNSVFGGSESSLPREGGKRFWERPEEHWDAMMGAGPHAYVLAARNAVPLMIPQQKGLIINITAQLNDAISGNLYYDLAMTSVNRMTLVMAKELKEYNVSSLALCPGWMRTETTAYVGRAVVALATDAHIASLSGRAIEVAELAHTYGFTDVDGTRPAAF
ncbi:NAD(P)-dependent dehydrogenase (short-subunit alcohol dehydrogenase family) [Rossellomorea marisflavi]